MVDITGNDRGNGSRKKMTDITGRKRGDGPRKPQTDTTGQDRSKGTSRKKGPSNTAAWQSASDKAQKKAEDRRLGGMGGSRESIAAHNRDRRLYFASQAAEEEVQEDSGSGRGLMDFLQEALGMQGGSSAQFEAGPSAPRINYDGMRKDLNDRAGSNDQRLTDVYRQLQGQYEANGPAVKAMYDKTGEQVGANFDKAAANVDEAAKSTRNEQARMFDALGIGDAAANIVENGDDAGIAAQQAKQNLAQNQAANVSTLNQSGAAAQTFNTAMGQSAGISGANKRADLSAQLQSRMAELGMMEQKDNQQAAQQDADNQRQAASMNADSENRRYSQALQMAQMMMSEQQWNTTRGDNLEQGAAELAQRQMQSQAELVEQQRRDTEQAMESTGPNADSIQSIIDLLAKSNIKPGDDKFAQTFSAYQRTR
jgi:hypothetical protein